MKFIKEYERFYLYQHKSGYLECFLKCDYKVIDGKLMKRKNNSSSEDENINYQLEKCLKEQ